MHWMAIDLAPRVLPELDESSRVSGVRTGDQIRAVPADVGGLGG